MNKPEFIELLNLYVDREISPLDATRLEEEVLKHADRREIYLEYCRIHKACATLAEQFREAAPAAPAEAAEIAFAPRRFWTPALLATGFAAAAACVIAAVSFGHRSIAPAAAESENAALAASAAPAVAAAPALRPVFTGRPQAALVSAQPSADFDWISQLRLDPVPRPAAPDQLFAFKPDLKPQTGAVSPASSLAPTEMTAFQIQK